MLKQYDVAVRVNYTFETTDGRVGTSWSTICGLATIDAMPDEQLAHWCVGQMVLVPEDVDNFKQVLFTELSMYTIVDVSEYQL